MKVSVIHNSIINYLAYLCLLFCDALGKKSNSCLKENIKKGESFLFLPILLHLTKQKQQITFSIPSKKLLFKLHEK